MRGFVFALFSVSIIFLSSASLAFADNDIGQSRIHPASFFYFLKTIRENLELKFAGTPRVTMIRQLEFATRRLREVRALIPTNHQDLIEPTLERYWFHISRLSDKDLKDTEIVTRIKESLVIHLEVLEQVYNQVSNTRAKMAIRAAINRVIQRADLPNYAKLPACNFLAKEASSSALNETEREVLKERVGNCLKGLERK